MPQISHLALVDPAARLADDVEIGPFCYVGPDVRIGAGCRVGPNATVTGRTEIGARTRISPLAVIGLPPGDADDAACRIGEANLIREHVTICGGVDEPTRIGSANLIMIGCHVGAGARLGDHGIFDNFTQIGAGAVVEDYVRAGAFTAVADGRKIGAYSFTVGYVHVDRDAPPYARLQGSPWRVRGVNTVNLRRCGFGEDDIRALRTAFRELFNGVGPEVNADVLERLGKTPGNPYVARLVEALVAAEAQREDDD